MASRFDEQMRCPDETRDLLSPFSRWLEEQTPIAPATVADLLERPTPAIAQLDERLGLDPEGSLLLEPETYLVQIRPARCGSDEPVA